MKIFLPPSEGKTAPSAGSTLQFESLIFPQLTQCRAEVLHELETVSARDDADQILGVGAKILQEVREQTNLCEKPCAPAWQIYTGVLFEAMHWDELAQNEAIFVKACEKVLIFSALFGVTAPLDHIPAYRLAMGVKLPHLGSTASLWKRALRNVPLADNELVVDCRSGAYKVWNPSGGTLVSVTAVRERDGKRTAVSHNAKHIRGVLAGDLLRAAATPETPQDLAEFAHVLVDAGQAAAVELTALPASRAVRAGASPADNSSIVRSAHVRAGCKVSAAQHWQLTIVQ